MYLISYLLTENLLIFKTITFMTCNFVSIRGVQGRHFKHLSPLVQPVGDWQPVSHSC